MVLTILETSVFILLEKDLPQVYFATKFFLFFLAMFLWSGDKRSRKLHASLYSAHPSLCIPEKQKAMMDVDGTVNM